ncbi:MAG: hypothetical protein RCG16_00025 [Rickettsia hoogstraalii]
MCHSAYDANASWHTHGKLKLLHLEDGGLYLQRDYQVIILYI